MFRLGKVDRMLVNGDSDLICWNAIKKGGDNVLVLLIAASPESQPIPIKGEVKSTKIEDLSSKPVNPLPETTVIVESTNTEDETKKDPVATTQNTYTKDESKKDNDNSTDDTDMKDETRNDHVASTENTDTKDESKKDPDASTDDTNIKDEPMEGASKDEAKSDNIDGQSQSEAMNTDKIEVKNERKKIEKVLSTHSQDTPMHDATQEVTAISFEDAAAISTDISIQEKKRNEDSRTIHVIHA
jgi:hypothetical protein